MISHFFTNGLLHNSSEADKGKVWGHSVPETREEDLEATRCPRSMESHVLLRACIGTMNLVAERKADAPVSFERCRHINPFT
jgi:hypothetical protein